LQDGSQCTTRNLRENHGFSGLMMDGGNSRPEINLQQEMMFSHNIVQLFKKHKVPHPGFDHLTVDLDQNTFWIALAVLRGGFKPRSLTVEINRNFAWHDSYATVDMPQEMAFIPDGCADYVGRACSGAQSIGKPLPSVTTVTHSAALRAVYSRGTCHIFGSVPVAITLRLHCRHDAAMLATLLRTRCAPMR
jgi:hypothetical protein